MHVLVLFGLVSAVAAIAACIPFAAIKTARKDDPHAPLHLQDPAYGSVRRDSNVAWLEDYRRARGVYLRRKGRTLLANRPFVPEPSVLRPRGARS